METWWWRPLPNPNKLLKYEGPLHVSFVSFFPLYSSKPLVSFPLLNCCRSLKLSLLLSSSLFLLFFHHQPISPFLILSLSLCFVYFFSHKLQSPMSYLSIYFSPCCPVSVHSHSPYSRFCLWSLRNGLWGRVWKVRFVEEHQPVRHLFLVAGAYTWSHWAKEEFNR